MAKKIAEDAAEEEWDETANRPVNKTLARIKVTVSSVVYIFLVFIVIYGLTDGVYNGFPKFVPYIIITVFLLMSFVRMYQGITGKIPEKKKKKKWWQKWFQQNDEAGEETEDDEEETNEYEEDE